MFKKAVCLLLCLWLPLTALAEDSLLDYAMTVSNRVCEQADDETWLNMMFQSAEVRDVAAMIGGGHEAPRLVLESELDPSIAPVIGTQLLAELGTETLAACVATGAETIFAAELTGAGAYVLLYDDASPVLVTWRANSGAVKMLGLCLPHPDLAKCASVEEVEAWFAERYLPLSFRVAESVPFALPASHEVDLAEEAKALSARMHEQAGQGVPGTSAALTELIADWSAGKMDEPWLVMHGEASLHELADMLLMDDGEASRILVRRMMESMPVVFLTQLMGTETVAASSMLSVNEVFAADGLPDVGLMLLLYREAVPVMIAWHAENGAAQMTAYYMPVDALRACQTPEEAAAWLDALGLPLDWRMAE